MRRLRICQECFTVLEVRNMDKPTNQIWFRLAEIGLALAFAASIFWGRSHHMHGGSGVIAVIPTIVLLTAWWASIVISIRRLDELQQAIETRSLAIAGGLTVWITIVWGFLQLALEVPELPLFMVGPLAAMIYGGIRLIVGVKYR